LNESEAEKAELEIRATFNVKTKSYKIDVSDYEAIKKLKQVMEIDFPGQSVDILINNADVSSLVSLREGHYQQIQKVIDVNFTSHLWVTMNE
jgi:all-trans-retinol dehydrogenase (NAD+)